MITLPPKLSNLEQTNLINRIKKFNTLEDKNYFILHNGRLAVRIAHFFNCDKDTQEELESVALVALIEAINKIITLQHNNVIGYLLKCIYGSCLTFLKNNKVEKVTCTIEEDILADPNNDFEIIDLIDSISVGCNQFEKDVLEKRSQGYTDQEIADE